MNKSLNIIEKLIVDGLYEEGPSPNGEEPRADMLQQIMNLRSTMGPAKQQEFDEFVIWYNNQRYAFPGDVPQILSRLHPYQLQQVVQKFRSYGHTPEETPNEE